MKHCSNSSCRADNPDDAIFCHMCGKRIKKKNNLSFWLYVSVLVELFSIAMFVCGYTWVGIVSIVASFVGMYIFVKKAE